MANSFIYQNQTHHIGDTVKAHLQVSEGEKTRTQIFEGIIIRIKGMSPRKTVTLRKIATGAVGVERTIPINAPTLLKIESKSLAKVRRAKLYYLRNRIGKSATKVKLQVADQKPSSNTKKTTPHAKPAPKTNKSTPKSTKKTANKPKTTGI